MNQSALLTKLYNYFHMQTKGIISNQILRTLPSSGPIIEQLKQIGLLSSDGATFIHDGKTVEAIRTTDHQIIDITN